MTTSGNQKTRRQQFQLHLSTALAMMFAAGGLIWANTAERQEIVRDGPSAEAFEETSESLPGDPIYKCYGWPFTAARQHVGASMAPGQEAYYSISNALKFNGSAAAHDLAIGLVVLLGVWIFCESWIRSRLKSRERET